MSELSTLDTARRLRARLEGCAFELQQAELEAAAAGELIDTIRLYAARDLVERLLAQLVERIGR